MKPQTTGDVQALPLGSQVVTALQGRPISSSPPAPSQVLGWASTNKQWTPAYPPGYEIGYDQITATVNVTGLASNSTTVVIAGSSHTFDGGPVIAEIEAAAAVTPSVAGGQITIGLYEGATLICLLTTVQTPAAANMWNPVHKRLRFTPSAGNHTYSVQAFVSVTTGTPQVVAGTGSGFAYEPAFLRFTKV